MLLETQRISNFQLIVLMIGFMFGTSIIISPSSAAGHDAWIAALIGTVESLLVAGIFTSLANRFKDKTVMEINDLVLGTILGKICSLIFIWYMFHISALSLATFSLFFSSQIYPETPRALLLVLIVLVCGLSVARGPEVLARCSVVLVLFTCSIIIIDLFLTLPTMNIKHLLPVLDIPTVKLLWASHNIVALPLGQSIVFSIFFVFLDNHQGRFKPTAIALLITGISLTALILRNILVLGPMENFYNFPSYTALQMIDIADIITRVEVFIAIFFIFTTFIKTSVLLYATTLGIAQVFKLKSSRIYIVPVGILMVIFALTNVENIVSLINFSQNTYPIYIIPWEILIPLITLIIAKIRKLSSSGGDS